MRSPWFPASSAVLVQRLWLVLLGPWLAGPATASDDALGVMTYNVRYANENPGEAWSTRRPLLAACIRSFAPDLIGTQEALYSQLRDIAEDLPEYDWIGLGRQGGSRDEFVAVFFREDRLAPQEFDHFWLSDTPEVIGSMTWGNQFRRMVTWVRFRDRITGQEFYFWNTHFDHQVQEARLKSAALIRARVAKLDPALPVVLVGDFNADGESNPVHAVLTNGDFFEDAWQTARWRRGGRRGTFNGFGTFPGGLGRIDWILGRGSVAVESAEVVEYAEGGLFPSDHFPVVARLRFTPAVSGPAETRQR